MQLSRLNFLSIKDLSFPYLYIKSQNWHIKAPPKPSCQFQTCCNFKFPIFVGRKDNNFQMWIEMALNKTRQYQILLEHWVREAGNFLEQIALG